MILFVGRIFIYIDFFWDSMMKKILLPEWEYMCNTLILAKRPSGDLTTCIINGK
jgi:hypothetical protein